MSFVVDAIASLRNAFVPMAAVFFTMRENPWAIFAALGIGAFIAGASAVSAYISWRRLTYTVSEEDIRVESGILSRAARSVPYERIQDVSIEQGLIPRFFGLVQVKFETGAGGSDDLALKFLSEEEGERLREVIKARKDGVVAAKPGQEAVATLTSEPAEILFAMDKKRLLTFGFFEFSLAVFAVLAGLFQYADTFLSIELWDADLWSEWFAGPGSFISGLGIGAQIIGVAMGLLTLLVVGSFTGLVRTFLRDWGFVLERTEKGFRRRRGMLTKTDVVMPIHRVQAINVSTGLLRRRFGWYGLKFVSLSQDSGSSSHDVAPFAKIRELDPIAKVAGFAIEPDGGADWQRGKRNYRIDSAIIEALVFFLIALVVVAAMLATDVATPTFALLPLAAGGLFAARQMFLWRFDFNALDDRFLFIRRGWLAPKLEVSSRIRLQSVEITQGPISRRRGYGTLKLGLAGGSLEVEGLPISRARQLRSAILNSIAKTDFSELAG